MARPPASRSPVGGSGAGEPRPPLRADARRNRARVLDAAQDAFGAEGSNVSLDEIARRAGVGAGTVYRHFASKEALFEAVVVDRIGQLAADARALVEAADPGPDLLAFVDRLGREAANKRDVVEAFARGGTAVHLGVGDAVRDLAHALAEPLQRAQDAGAVRADVDVEDVIAVAGAAGAAIRLAGGDEARIATVLTIITDGLRPRP